MRIVYDLSGYWQGSLTLQPDLDVKAPPVIERDFYLPLSWNIQIEDLLWPGSPWRELTGVIRPLQNQNFRDLQRKYNEGTIRYQRSLPLPATPAGHRAFLVFEGSNYRTEAWVNGKSVGTHDGGHLPFEFEITGAVLPGENHFELRVDNLRRKAACPQEQFNWRNYGGVYRPLRVEWRPDPAIAQVNIRPLRRAAGWCASVEVTFGSPFQGDIIVEIESGASRTQAARTVTGASASCRMEIPVGDPVVWEPGVGGISHARVRLAREGQTVDEQHVTFGFREIAFRDGRIHINGQPIRLYGAAMHEQHPAMGSSLTPWQARQDIKLLKNAGFNALRTSHYPHARGLYEACDREGILVIADLPCWQFNAFQFEDPSCRELTVRVAREMAIFLNRHPSVIGWNIETESSIHLPSAHAFFEAVASVLRAEDPDRLLISASQTDPPEHLAIVKQAKTVESAVPPQIIDLVDIAGINDYSGWYGEKAPFMGDHLDHVHAKAPGKTFLVTEFGAESTPGQRSLTMEHYSEDYQAELLAYHIGEILRRDYIAGFFMWLFIDYECASIGISGINAKGLLDPYRRPKLAYNRVRQLLRQT
jgi:beta-glucuronidase